MLSYLIDWETEPSGDLLHLKFDRQYRASGEQIVRDACSQIARLQADGKLNGGKLLKIDGPASVAVSYAIAAQLSEPELRYGAIAVYDPKIGAKGKKSYIVAITDGSQYQLGEVIASDQPQVEKPKVVLCGPSRSGKSCLREGLKQALFRLEDAPYPYVITACPDGEGAWYSAAAQRDPQLARWLKQQYKAKFTPDFARKAAGWVRSANTALNLIDVGGARSPENRLIMAQATHAVILSREATEIPPWLEFCQDLGLSVVALLYSHRQGKEDWLQRKFPLLTGIIDRLERGEDASSRPVVQALARQLVNLTQQEYPTQLDWQQIWQICPIFLAEIAHLGE